MHTYTHFQMRKSKKKKTKTKTEEIDLNTCIIYCIGCMNYGGHMILQGAAAIKGNRRRKEHSANAHFNRFLVLKIE